MKYSPLCHSKPVRPFIFGTQIKTFLMKSEIFLTLQVRHLEQIYDVFPQWRVNKEENAFNLKESLNQQLAIVSRATG